MAKIEIDITDYIDNHYVDIDFDLDDFENDDIIEHLESEGYYIYGDERKISFNNSSDDFKRLLCDLLELNYHASKTEILKIIRSKL